jgi:hypothetical protein
VAANPKFHVETTTGFLTGAIALPPNNFVIGASDASDPN